MGDIELDVCMLWDPALVEVDLKNLNVDFNYLNRKIASVGPYNQNNLMLRPGEAIDDIEISLYTATGSYSCPSGFSSSSCFLSHLMTNMIAVDQQPSEFGVDMTFTTIKNHNIGIYLDMEFFHPERSYTCRSTFASSGFGAVEQSSGGGGDSVDDVAAATSGDSIMDELEFDFEIDLGSSLLSNLDILWDSEIDVRMKVALKNPINFELRLDSLDNMYASYVDTDGYEFLCTPQICTPRVCAPWWLGGGCIPSVCTPRWCVFSEGPATIPVLNNLYLNTQFTLTPGSQTWSNFIDVRFSGDALFPIAMDLMAGTSPSMEGLGVAKASFQHANDAKFRLELAITIPEMVLDV